MNDEMKRFLLSLAALLAAAASLLAQRSDVLSVKSYVLDNGMQVWINEDPSHPTAYGAVVVKAGARFGSADEETVTLGDDAVVEKGE